MDREILFENIKNKEYDKALEWLDQFDAIQNDSELLLIRADIYFKKLEYSNAYNSFLAVLKLEPDNFKAQTGVDMCKKILHFKNFNRYADPNTHMDPWLEF